MAEIVPTLWECSMASIDLRLRASGPVYRVRFGPKADRQQAEFTNETDALLFDALVKEAGQQWPTPGRLRARGLIELAAERDLASRPSAGRVTLVDWCRRHVNDYSNATDANKAKYQRMITNHMGEWFGEMTLAAVTGRDILNWQRYMADDDTGRGLADKTIRNTRSAILAPALAAATRRDLDGNPPVLEYNPCEGVPVPNGKSVRPSVWTQDEVTAVLTAALTIDRRAYALLATLAGTAMRWSEAVAITTHAVYPDRGLIEVRQVARKNAASQWRLHHAPKTEEGFRPVAAGPAVLALLAAQDAADGALILTNSQYGLWRHETFFDGPWAKIRKRCGGQGTRGI